MPIPNHIAIIPDGNRRWAKAQRLNPWDGHTEGAQRFWTTAQELFDMGLEHLSIWGASYDNLKKRSKIEVNFLLNILKTEIVSGKILDLAVKNKVQVRVIGEWKELLEDAELIKLISDLEQQTKSLGSKTVNLLFAYDGQREMLSAIEKLSLSQETVTDENLRKYLWTSDLPDVDYVIRTGGEPHWSAGFMMWLTANSQFYFTETLWPDFKSEQIKKAVDEYDRRERRLGK